MTAVDSSEAGKQLSSKSRKRKEKRKERKRIKGKFRLARRLERYKKISEQTKAARAKTPRQRTVEKLPGKLLEISSRIVAKGNTAVQLTLPPVQINPQLAMAGNCFWLNYQNVFTWKDRHMSNLSAYSFPGPLQQHMIPPPNPQIYQECQETRSQEVDVPQYVNISAAESECYEAGELHEGEEGEHLEEGSESDCDIVVTEEMMQFLEISMRHKATREREKIAAKELERKKRIEERDTIDDCQVPTEEDENEKRLREMSELYGTDAAKIHGMETALQLNFNRQLDLFNPSYWPFYPFSMQFKGVTALK